MNKSKRKLTRKQTRNQAAKELVICKDCQREIDDPLDTIFNIENDVQISLKNDEYVRATHIIEAPIGKEGDYVWAPNNDNTYDLHIFLQEDEFALLKVELEEDEARPVVTFNYCPDCWKEHLA